MNGSIGYNESNNTENQLFYLNPIDQIVEDLESPIFVSTKNTMRENRDEGKPGIDYKVGANVFLRFLDESDRRDFQNGFPGNKDVFIITHGFSDTTVFGTNSNAIYPISYKGVQNVWIDIAKNLKAEKKAQGKDVIILLLDWSNIAAGETPGLGSNGDLLKASSFINSTANAVFDRLNTWGLKDATKVNMIGHSLGTYMSNEIGRTYFEATNKKIKSMVLLDPASDWGTKDILNSEGVLRNILNPQNNFEISMPVKFTKNRIGIKNPSLYVKKFTDFAEHSISFGGRLSIAGNEGLMLSANESYWMSYDNNDMPAAAIHTYVNSTFLAINSDNKLKLNKSVTLDYNSYNPTSMQSRDFKPDLTQTDFIQHCSYPSVFDLTLDCTQARDINYCSKNFSTSTKLRDCIYKTGSECSKNKLYNNCRKNDWYTQSWFKHNGLVVSNKPGNSVEYGFVNPYNTKLKTPEKTQIFK
jgi:pimeloyl-ACP methyl ester carboxylesterase